MVAIPSGIIFVNNDLVDQVRDYLVKQLHISGYMDGYTFDQIIEADSTYPDKIKQLNRRILVIRSFAETTNRELADVAIFVKNAIVHVEQNNFGPNRPQFPILNICWGNFGKY